MATRKVLLDEDVTGLNINNFIELEKVITTASRDRLVVLEYGSFFTNNLVIVDKHYNVIDPSKYMFCDLYQEACMKSGKEVWNAIIILEEDTPTELYISYFAYGGKFSTNGRLLIEWLNERLNESVDPIQFADIIDKPKEFTPSFHYHLWKEVYGYSFIKAPLTRIENAIELDNSIFFNMLIDSIKAKLVEAENRAMNLARYYAERAVSEAISDINKQSLDLHLLANLTIASKEEMQNIAKNNFDEETIINDKYINKKGLQAFNEILRERCVSSEKTGLGINIPIIKESKKGSLLAASNSSVFTLRSKEEIVASENYYEDTIYPKNYPASDRFTIVRVTNNLKDHGGLFLGFNNTTCEMYSGVLSSDRCFMRLKWYRFYSDVSYDSIIDALKNHTELTNNPHKITKKQVNLDNVTNLPVITLDEIMGDEPVDAYITLDTLSAFMIKHLLDLKPEFKEDGTLDKDSDLFNKPNVIFTPCDKKVPDNWPPKGQLLKTYCDGSDRFQRLADGQGGFTDEVLELNSFDCNFKDIPMQGTVLHSYCEDKNEKSVVADGRGSTTLIITGVNSIKCGYIPLPEAGTVLGEGCSTTGHNLIRKVADGIGGVIETVIEANSLVCGYIPLPEAGTVLEEFCVGMALSHKIADGVGGVTIITVDPQSTLCGFVSYPAEGTFLREGCKPGSKDYVKYTADGNGGEIETVIEINSLKCGATSYPPAGTIIGEECSATGTALMNKVADGYGGFTLVTVTAQSPKCGFVSYPAVGTFLREGCKPGTKNFVKYTADGNGGEIETIIELNSTKCGETPPVQHPDYGTLISEGCKPGTYSYVKKLANGVGGTYEEVAEVNSVKCGYIAPTQAPPPTRNPRIRHTSDYEALEPGTVETLSASLSGYSPYEVVDITGWARCIIGVAIYNGYNFNVWSIMLNDTVRCDAQGNGEWTYTHVNDNTIMPVDTTWENKMTDSDGTSSSVFLRRFVRAGQSRRRN